MVEPEIIGISELVEMGDSDGEWGCGFGGFLGWMRK